MHTVFPRPAVPEYRVAPDGMDRSARKLAFSGPSHRARLLGKGSLNNNFVEVRCNVDI